MDREKGIKEKSISIAELLEIQFLESRKKLMAQRRNIEESNQKEVDLSRSIVVKKVSDSESMDEGKESIDESKAPSIKIVESLIGP